MRIWWIFWLKLFGWNTEVNFPAGLKKTVIIVAPHTSNWDFIIGLAYRSVLKLTNAKYLGKEELFKSPFGWFFKWLGGTPVNRKSHQNMVEQVVEKFNAYDEFILALSPEGTRKKVDQLKTGFYYIAQQANVPIVMVGLDYEKKTIQVGKPFFTSQNKTEDLKNIIQFFGAIKGKNQHQGLQHLL